MYFPGTPRTSAVRPTLQFCGAATFAQMRDLFVDRDVPE